MSKVNKPTKIKLPRVKLAWRDVLTLEQIFREHFDVIRLHSEKKVFHSSFRLLEHVKNKARNNIFSNKKKLKDLTFEAIEPYSFKLVLNQSKSIIDCEQDDFHSQAIAAQLRNFLQRYTIEGLKSKLIIILPVMVALLVILFSIVGFNYDNIKEAWWFKFVSGAFVALPAVIQVLISMIQEPVVDLTDDLSVRLYDQMNKRLEIQDT